MLFTINKCDVKNDGWKILSIRDLTGVETHEVSINRVDKTGVVAFPIWDAITVGNQVEGELWRNPSGRWYLFPPKPKKDTGGSRVGAMKQMAEEKDRRIRANMDAKDEAIRWSGSTNKAVELAIAEMEYRLPRNAETFEVEDDLKRRILYWRDFLLLSYDWDLQEPFDQDPRK